MTTSSTPSALTIAASRTDPLGVVGWIGDLDPAQPVADREAVGERHHLLVGGHPGDEAHSGGDHSQRRGGHGGGDEPDPLPRILLVKADRHGHVGAGGEVERVVADPIQRRSDRQHIGRGQAGGAPQALIAVPGGGVDELDWLGHRIARSSQSVVTAPGRKSGWPSTPISSVRFVSTPFDVEVLERVDEDRDGAVAIVGVGDQLAEQRVVVGRNGRTGLAVGVHPQSGALGDREERQPARAGSVAAGWILGVEPAFDRVTVEGHVVLPDLELLAGRDLQLHRDQVEAR